MSEDQKPEQSSELDQIEAVLDRFLERRLGAVGRYRTIALLAAIAIGLFNAYRCGLDPHAMTAMASSASSQAFAASASPTPPLTLRFDPPGLR